MTKLSESEMKNLEHYLIILIKESENYDTRLFDNTRQLINRIKNQTGLTVTLENLPIDIVLFLCEEE